jgi:hypothetical protein
MPKCQMSGCSNMVKGSYKHCPKCHFSGKGRKRNGYFRMIVHSECSEFGENSVLATHSKSCGICNNMTNEGSEIDFITICVNCARDKDTDSLIAMTQSGFDDFCKICRTIIGKTTNRYESKKEEEETPIEAESAPLNLMVRDLSRIMNGVVKIKRETLLNRLVQECNYSMKDASYAVTSILSNEAYVEDDGMIFLRKDRF